MTLEDTVKRHILLYPTIFTNALDVYNELFCDNHNSVLGWGNGEVYNLFDREWEIIPTFEEAIFNSLNKYLINICYSRYPDFLKSIYKYKKDVGVKIGMKEIKKHHRALFKDIKKIFEFKERCSNFSLEDILKKKQKTNFLYVVENIHLLHLIANQ